MREPRLGEALICGACQGECDVVDEEYIILFNKLLKKHGEDMLTAANGLYDVHLDKFKSYDGCEDVRQD
jgi:hypothetical protein